MRNATCVETQTSKVPTTVDLLSIPYTVVVLSLILSMVIIVVVTGFWWYINIMIMMISI